MIEKEDLKKYVLESLKNVEIVISTLNEMDKNN